MKRYALVIPLELGGLWFKQERGKTLLPLCLRFHHRGAECDSRIEQKVREAIEKKYEVALTDRDTLRPSVVITQNGPRRAPRRFYVYLLDTRDTWHRRLTDKAIFIETWCYRRLQYSREFRKLFGQARD